MVFGSIKQGRASLFRRALSFVFIIILAPITLFGLYRLATEKGFFNIEKITISVQDSDIDQTYLMTVLPDLQTEIQKIKHKNIWEINQNEINNLFNKYNFVADYLVVKHWPNHLEVNIKISESLLWMENSKGVRPLFKNKKWGKYIKNDLIDRVDKIFIDHLEAEKNLLTLIKLSQVVDKKNKIKLKDLSKIKFIKNNTIVLTLKSKQTDILLTESLIENQVERVTQVLDYLERYQIEARVIDSQFTKKVLVRLQARP